MKDACKLSMFGGTVIYDLVTFFFFRHVGLISMLPPPLHANIEYLPQPAAVVEVVDATYAAQVFLPLLAPPTLKWNGTQS